MAETHYPKIFITHSWHDIDFARRLYDDLKARGFDIWLDDKTLRAGHRLVEEINRGLQWCDVYIPVISRAALASEWCWEEINAAITLSMQPGRSKRPRIVSVLIEDCASEMLPSLAARLYISFIGRRYEDALRELTEKGLEVTLPATQIGAPPVRHHRFLENRALRWVAGVLAGFLIILFLITPWIVSQVQMAPTPTVAPSASAIALLPIQISTYTPTLISTSTLSATPTLVTTPPRTATRTLMAGTATPIGSSQLISIEQSFPAPAGPTEGIAWDGRYLWLADNSGTIFQLDTNGRTLGAYRAPEVTPKGLAWDGSSFWLFTTNYAFIYQFQIEGRETKSISSFKSPAKIFGGGITQDLAWGGNSLWYANQYNVYQLDTKGSILSSFAFPQNVSGIDWDGTNLWIAYNTFPGNATLSVVDTTGNVLASFPAPIFQIDGLTWGDSYLWAVGRDSLAGKMRVYQLNVSLAKEALSVKSATSWRARVSSVRRTSSLQRHTIPPTPTASYESTPGLTFLVVGLGLESDVPGAVLYTKDIVLTDDRERKYPLAGIQSTPSQFTLGSVSGMIRMGQTDPPYLTFSFEIKRVTPFEDSITTGDMPAAAPSGSYPTLVLVWNIPTDAKGLRITLPGAPSVELGTQ